MNKAETGTARFPNRDLASRESANTFVEDVKALVKIGIVNSNLMMVFAGFWLALHFNGLRFTDHWDVFIWTIFGSGLVIAGGCILNNWYDRDIDPLMRRTKMRPTVTGSISAQQAFVLGLSVSAAGFVLLLFTTAGAVLAALAGWIVYVVLYTVWSKRRYTLNTAIGSLSGAVPPLIGWLAIDPRPHIIAVGLFLIMFIWQTPHFLALAMKKNEEYKAAGIPMLPAVYGFSFTKRQIVIYIACLLPLPFYMADLGNVFLWIATGLNAAWLILGIAGFFMKDQLKWAHLIFVYSLNYLTILFALMFLVTI